MAEAGPGSSGRGTAALPSSPLCPHANNSSMGSSEVPGRQQPSQKTPTNPLRGYTTSKCQIKDKCSRAACFRSNVFLQKRRLHTGSFQHHNSLLTKVRGWSRECKKQVLQTIPHISLHITKHIQKSPKYPGLVPKLLLHCKRTVYPGTRVTVLLRHLGTTKCLCVKSGGSGHYGLCLELLILHLSSACTTWKCSYTSLC